MSATITTKCPHCQHAIAFDERAVGKETHCQRCGSAYTVTAQSAEEMVSFTCVCGKEHRVRASHVGRRAKCASCGTSTTIPAPVPQEVAANTDSFFKAKLRKAMEADTQAEADAETKATPSKAGKRWLIATGILVVLGLAGAGVWFSQSGAGMRRAVQRLASSSTQPVDLSLSRTPQTRPAAMSRPASELGFAPALSLSSSKAPEGAPTLAMPFSQTQPDTRVVDEKHPREIATFHHGDAVTSLSISRDGRRWLSAGGSVQVYDLETGKQLLKLIPQTPVSAAALSPDGARLLWGSANTGDLHLCDAVNGRELSALEGHDKGTTDIVFSPNGMEAASAGNDQTARLWDLSSGKLRFSTPGSTPVQALTFSPHGHQLFTARSGGKLEVFDTVSGKLVDTIETSREHPESIAVSPDDQMLIVGGGNYDDRAGAERTRYVLVDTGLFVYNLATRKQNSIGNPNCFQMGVAFAPNGRFSVSYGGFPFTHLAKQQFENIDNTIRVWRINPPSVIFRYPASAKSMQCMAVCPNGKHLLAGDEDGTVHFLLLPSDCWTKPAPVAANDAIRKDPGQRLSEIRGKLASEELATLTRDSKWEKASFLLDEVESDLRGVSIATNLPLWDATLAPMMRRLDGKRALVAAHQPSDRSEADADSGDGTSGVGFEAIAPARPARFTPDQNKKLAEVRTRLATASIQMRDRKLSEAQRTVADVQDRLRRFAEESQIPVWHATLTALFQTAAARETELEAHKHAGPENGQAAPAAAAEADKDNEVAVDQPTTTGGLTVGTLAPAFAAMMVDGREFTTAHLKGKWLLLDFWASWCGPCRAEIPYIREVYEAYAKDKRLIVMSLSLDKQLTTAANFTTQNKMNWVQAYVGSGSWVTQMYNARGIPTIMLVAPDGRVAANGLRGEAIKATLDEALAVKGAASR